MTETIPEDECELAKRILNEAEASGETDAVSIIARAIMADRATRPAAVPGWRLVPEDALRWAFAELREVVDADNSFEMGNMDMIAKALAAAPAAPQPQETSSLGIVWIDPITLWWKFKQYRALRRTYRAQRKQIEGKHGGRS